MISIVDCGSTKAEWVFLEGDKIVERYVTNGFNPNFCDINLLSSIALEIISQNVNNKDAVKIFFYGSGCGSTDNVAKVKVILKEIFYNADVEVYSDILASCHALLGSESGIASILGTGSNACFYDGEKIAENATSLGFILGDEGSGCHIGKKIAHDYFYGTMPDELRQKFEAEYRLTRNTLIEKVYKSPQPSRFLASFAKFAGENTANQYIIDVVSSCFNDFIKYCINPLGKCENIGFVGSVAYHFQDILKKCLENQNLNVKKIVKSPTDGLVDYYAKR
ncbi:MAG: hypothetical protein MJ000_02865 [Bacteroidales bacterium]|nr:hypothetical protein [Bacteroidales bacterium]